MRDRGRPMAVVMAQFPTQSSKAGFHSYVAISPSACKLPAGADHRQVSQTPAASSLRMSARIAVGGGFNCRWAISQRHERKGDYRTPSSSDGPVTKNPAIEFIEPIEPTDQNRIIPRSHPSISRPPSPTRIRHGTLHCTHHTPSALPGLASVTRLFPPIASHPSCITCRRAVSVNLTRLLDRPRCPAHDWSNAGPLDSHPRQHAIDSA